MANRLFNLARMTTPTTGTGSTITLGAAITGFLSFAAAGVANGNVVSYSIRDGANSEAGTATYSTSGPSLTGRTPITSTNSNAAINLSGSAEVVITPIASDFFDPTISQGSSNKYLGIGAGAVPPTKGRLQIDQNDGSNACGMYNNSVGATTTPNNLGISGDHSYNYVTVYPEIMQANATFGWQMQVFITGGTGAKHAIRGEIDLFGSGIDTGGDIIGVSGLAGSTFPNGGTNTGAGAKGTLFGAELGAFANSGATNYFVVSGGEAGAHIATGGSAKNRWGWSCVAYAQVQGSVTDGALEIGASGSAPWKTGILFDTAHGIAALDTSGTVIGTDGVSATIANGIDLSAWTITGYFLKGPSNGFLVDGSGNLTAKDATFNTGSGSNVLIGNDSTFNTLSLNNAVAFPNVIGLQGGGDSHLYHYSQDQHIFYSGSAVAAILNGSGQLKLGGGLCTSNPRTITTATATIGATDFSIICNFAGTVTLTLPSAASNPGRILKIRTILAQAVNSSSSNVVLNTAAAGAAILAATIGKWAELQSDGSNWIVILNN